MAKGALEMKVMISLILVVTIILLFMVYGKTLFERGDTYADDAECKQSVQQNSLLRFGGTEFSSKITCPIKEVTVKDDPAVIRATVAEEIKNCWSTWGEGKLELFSADDKTFCAVCSVITFEKPGETITGLLPHLSQRVVVGSDKTYFEYLTGIGGDAQTALLNDPELKRFDAIDTSMPLSIVFTYQKDSRLSKKEGAVGGATAGLIAGAVLGGVLFVIFPPAGGVVLGTVLLAVKGAAVTATVIGTTAGGAAIGYGLGHDQSAIWDANLRILPYSSEQIFKNGGCNYFPASQTPTNTPITV